MKSTILTLLLAMSTLCGTASVARTFENSVDIAGVTDHLALGTQLVYLPDPDRNISAADLAADGARHEWTQSEVAVPNFGVGVAPYWFAIRLANSSPDDWHGLLDMSYTMMDFLDFYFVRDQQAKRVSAVGDQRPFSDRALANRNFLVPIEIPAGSSILILMRGESYGAMMFPLDLWRIEAFFQQDQMTLAPQLIFVGLMLALVLYNFFLLLGTRDLNYLWYVMSMVSISFVVTSFHGILAQFAWPELPILNNYVLVGAISCSIMAGTLFAYSFLDLQRFGRTLKYLFRGHTIAGLVIFILNFFLPYTTVIKAAALFSVTGASLGICTGSYLWYKGQKIARLYTIAWFSLLAGSVVLTLAHFGVLPGNFLFLHGQQIGAAAEGLLLSFALAYRINLERQKRFQVQAELLQMQTETNLKLEQRVQERTSELVQANAKLQEVSATDGLTQVRNRYFFDEKLLHEWQKNSREQSQMSLLMIDGDHFKAINDTHGHLCGDAILKHIAQIFRDAVNRAGDFVARYGGEEFTVLLCHTDLAGAATIAERIRSKVESTPISWEGKSIGITVSIGVACEKPSRDANASTLLQEADEALYQAKHGGRNRVVLFSKPDTAAEDSAQIRTRL